MLIKLLQCIAISDLWDITLKGNMRDAKFQKLTAIYYNEYIFDVGYHWALGNQTSRCYKHPILPTTQFNVNLMICCSMKCLFE